MYKNKKILEVHILSLWVDIICISGLRLDIANDIINYNGGGEPLNYILFLP